MDIIAGIDVSKARLDVAIAPSGITLSVDNNDQGIDELVQHLKAQHVDLIALEATGGYETLVAAKLSASGLCVIIVNPSQVRSYANAIGRRAKTDEIDAQVIAAFVLATKPQIRPLRDAQTQALSALVDRRRRIVQMIVAEENRLRLAIEKPTQKSIKRLLVALRREIESIDTDLDDHIRKSPVWRVREALLTSVPGVGTATARTFKGSYRLVHGSSRRQSIQPHFQGLPGPVCGCGQTKDRRNCGKNSQTADHFQRHHQGSKAIARRLMNKTVAYLLEHLDR